MSDAAERAWLELRAGQQVRSLAALVDLGCELLMTVRCSADRELIAGVWRTSLGPLLVTGHRDPAKAGPARVPTGTGVFRIGTPGQGIGQGSISSNHPWSPRVALANETLAGVFPLVCPRCMTTPDVTVDLVSKYVLFAILGGKPQHVDV